MACKRREYQNFVLSNISFGRPLLNEKDKAKKHPIWDLGAGYPHNNLKLNGYTLSLLGETRAGGAH